MRTLLLIHPGGLGDVILALPAIRAMGKAYPGHARGFLARREVGHLYSRTGEIDRNFPLESSFLAQLFAGPASVTADFRDWLVRCDVAVCWMNDSAGCVRSTLQALGVRQVITHSARVSDHLSKHQSDRLLDSLRQGLAQAIGEGGDDRTLTLPDDVIEKARELLRSAGVRDSHPIAVVHPGSGSRHKCCQPTVLAKTVDFLRACAKVPIVLQGPADEDMVRLVCTQVEKLPVVLRNLDVLTVAGVLAQAGLYVGHDSGITHLAAVLGIPTIALFGPTDVQRWAPRGPNVRILTGEVCQCRTWETVQQCVRKPCLDISAEQVSQTSRDLWREPSSKTRSSALPCHAS